MNASGDTTWNSTYVQSSFIQSLLPGYEQIIPNHNITSDGWVLANSTLFNTQWIDCYYPISGGYGRAPRYTFYGLTFFALVWRKHEWLARVALASVMVYSSTAAIHALTLLVGRTQMTSQSGGPNNNEKVMVDGSTSNSNWVPPIGDNWEQNGLWLPIIPMVWDSDIDAVLVILGISFLILAPMQAHSTTFKESKAKHILLIWSLLLLMGIICALYTEVYHSVIGFPQLRFCPLASNDTLPTTNSGSGPAILIWNPDDQKDCCKLLR
jgi:hypothetical protein